MHPQSQGIVERTHRELRSALAKLIEAYVRSNPRKWPKYVRWLEYKLRHHEIATDITPYQLVHGFRGSSELSTAMGAFKEIPQHILTSDWLRGIIAEIKELESRISEHWITQAEARMRKHEEETPSPSMSEGDLVLLAKPFYERGTGTILPQSDGPFIISRLPTTHTAILEDPFSGELYHGGKPVAASRLARFHYPSAWINEYEPPATTDDPAIDSLTKGDFVALEPNPRRNKRVYLGRIQTIHHDQKLLEVLLYHVPADSRFGPWQRRPWSLWALPDGRPRLEVIPYTEVLCPVTFQENALDQKSLTTLSHLGVDVGSTPHRDHSMPLAISS